MLIQLLKLIPKNALSYLVGTLVRVRWPRPIAIVFNWVFVRIFGIDMREAELPLADYASLEELFIRRLRIGSRPIAADLLCAPADGTLVVSAPATNSMAVQVKGIEYSLTKLVHGDLRTSLTQNLAWYTTIYLAPHNYHRVHYPVSAKLLGVRYIPGQLWPVNEQAVAKIPQLFTTNERLVFDFALSGGGKLFAAMVGALNVGRMLASAVPDFVTNATLLPRAQQIKYFALPVPIDTRAGDEMGIFMLGSTVVLAFDDQAAKQLRPMQTHKNQPILMGRSLCASLKA